jgi:outer membrane protein assembly factor BamD (BamD/ComL family)
MSEIPIYKTASGFPAKIGPSNFLPTSFQLFNRMVLLGFWFLISGIFANTYALNLDKIKVYFLNGDYKSAISEAEKLLSANTQTPDFDELYYLLGLSYMKDGNYLRASDIFEIILKEFNNSSVREEVLLGLGDAYFLKGDFSKAQDYYQGLIKSNPQGKFKAQLYYRLSQIGFKKGDTQQGAEYLEKLRNDFPLNPEAKINKDLCAITNTSSDFYYTVQVGSFANNINARNLREKLVQKGYPAYIDETNSSEGSRPIYRVRVGKSPLLDKIVELGKRLSQDGYPAKVCP